MDSSNQVLKQSEVEETIRKIDSITPSPAQRAKKVYTLLLTHKLSNWDLICFAVEYLASQALVYSWLKPYIKPAVKIVYNAHYYMPESSYLTEVLNNESQGTDSETVPPS